MPSVQRLLERAYHLIADNKTRDAAQVLDVVIEGDPHNIEAWELYMQISGSQAGLESLAERVHWNRELNPAEKDEILAYLDYKLSRLENESGPDFPIRPAQTGSRPALIIIAVIFVLLVGLWVSVPDVRSMTPFYFLMLFLLGLGVWFWRSDQPGQYGELRSFSYGVTSARLSDNDKPELFFQGPIIKVGPLPEDEEE
jgi:hypothetical protein